MSIPGVVAAEQLRRLDHHSPFSGWAGAWVAAGLVTFVAWTQWNERRARGRGETAVEANAYFLAAVETSLDAFSLLEAVRDESGEIADLRVQYTNRNMEKLLGHAEIQGALLSEISTVVRGTTLFGLLCGVIRSGESLNTDFPVEDGSINASWLRAQVVRLGDGIALTCSDISEMRAAEEQCRDLTEFSHTVFENAPFSIIATDAEGMITAMNKAAERLTGFERGDLTGKSSLTALHDHEELECASRRLASEGGPEDLFRSLTQDALAGETGEREWTLIRRDGVRTPVNVVMRTIVSETGEVTGFVSTAFDATERRQMLEYVTHLATHDQLTGLACRALLHERTMQAVEDARRRGTKVALFMIDLDNFKRLNDSLGHAAGDQLLIEASRRLTRSVRGSDTVGRVGGDEFVVVMTDITSVEDVERCATNLIAQLTPEISIEKHQVQLTASVGVCIYPDFASDAKHLLKRADSAMYAAKDNGRNQHLIFNQGMLKETAERLTMEHALRHALANDELKLHYQPQISLATGEITGMEALLRWTHPKLGNVPPAQFISLAEETGLIVAIGEWAFMRACRESAAVRRELGLDLTVSVNLSPRQLQQRDLAKVIERALAASGLPAERLQVEITENMLIGNSGHTLEMLADIRRLGVRISIDDFGTGFSSFSYLLQYQVDQLKIDQSFIKRSQTDPNAAAVVRTIIAMSHGLNIKVVAEGVETDEQMRFLLRRRCDAAQGNFIARPAAPEDFCGMVRKLRQHIRVRASEIAATWRPTG